MKMYLKGGKGIEKPLDFDGNEIKEGDILTFDSFDKDIDDVFYKTYYSSWSEKELTEWRHRPTYKVKWNDRGYFYGEGIKDPKDEFSGRLYLHDFRFKYTKIVKQ
ncbi:hypothetical protein [uncultured Chryseobacterium sp.]|uniref:hypothetical protein n=1 Tax=uncultured Chryseobacterium sp. TaxID=259322 RepID=UPI0025D6548D|nr:hypothetical protein [uncultured Chryseobacterium sp.]